MTILFETIHDASICKNIWDQIVQPQTLYDCWEFKFAFSNYHPLHFTIAKANNTLVELLPLQFNELYDYLEFFGGHFMEKNRIYTKPGYEYVKEALVKSCMTKANLRFIVPEDKFNNTLEFDDYTYRLNLQPYTQLDNYISSSSKKLRKNFHRTLDSINSLLPSIKLNQYNQLDELIKLNKQTHGKESLFYNNDIALAFHKLLRSDLNVTMLSLEFDNIPQSIAYGIGFKETYYALLSGTNKEFADGLGTYSKLHTVQYSINNKFLYTDFGRANCNWKESWELEKYPLYVYKNF